MAKRDWKAFARQAGAAYAAIVLSIVGINIPMGDQALPKKPMEHRQPSASDAAGDSASTDSATES